MKTIDFTVTIKNVPEKNFNKMWADTLDMLILKYKETVEPTNNIVLDFDLLKFQSMEPFFQIVSHAMSAYTADNATKIIAE